MKLVVLAAFIAVCGAAKLPTDRSYLPPPPSARTAGGNSDDLQTPNSGLPQGAYTNGFQGVIVDASAAGTRTAGVQQSGLGAPRPSYGFDGSKVGEAAFKTSNAAFRPSYDNHAFRTQNPADVHRLNSQNTPVNSAVSASAFAGFSNQNTPNFNQEPDAGQGQPTNEEANQHRTANVVSYNAEVGPDGFNYAFETDNGIVAEQNAIATNGVQAQGGYSYTSDDGQTYSVSYVADENGYQPVGDHLPTPPPIPEAILRSLEKNAQDEANGVVDDGSYDASKYNTGGDYNANDYEGKYNEQQYSNGAANRGTPTSSASASVSFGNQNNRGFSQRRRPSFGQSNGFSNRNQALENAQSVGFEQQTAAPFGQATNFKNNGFGFKPKPFNAGNNNVYSQASVSSGSNKSQYQPNNAPNAKLGQNSFNDPSQQGNGNPQVPAQNQQQCNNKCRNQPSQSLQGSSPVQSASASAQFSQQTGSNSGLSKEGYLPPFGGSAQSPQAIQNIPQFSAYPQSAIDFPKYRPSYKQNISVQPNNQPDETNNASPDENSASQPQVNIPRLSASAQVNNNYAFGQFSQQSKNTSFANQTPTQSSASSVVSVNGNAKNEPEGSSEGSQNNKYNENSDVYQQNLAAYQQSNAGLQNSEQFPPNNQPLSESLYHYNNPQDNAQSPDLASQPQPDEQKQPQSQNQPIQAPSADQSQLQPSQLQQRYNPQQQFQLQQPQQSYQPQQQHQSQQYQPQEQQQIQQPQSPYQSQQPQKPHRPQSQQQLNKPQKPQQPYQPQQQQPQRPQQQYKPQQQQQQYEPQQPQQQYQPQRPQQQYQPQQPQQQHQQYQPQPSQQQYQPQPSQQQFQPQSSQQPNQPQPFQQQYQPQPSQQQYQPQQQQQQYQPQQSQQQYQPQQQYHHQQSQLQNQPQQYRPFKPQQQPQPPTHELQEPYEPNANQQLGYPSQQPQQAPQQQQPPKSQQNYKPQQPLQQNNPQHQQPRKSYPSKSAQSQYRPQKQRPQPLSPSYTPSVEQFRPPQTPQKFERYQQQPTQNQLPESPEQPQNRFSDFKPQPSSPQPFSVNTPTDQPADTASTPYQSETTETPITSTSQYNENTPLEPNQGPIHEHHSLHTISPDEPQTGATRYPLPPTANPTATTGDSTDYASTAQTQNYSTGTTGTATDFTSTHQTYPTEVTGTTAGITDHTRTQTQQYPTGTTGVTNYVSTQNQQYTGVTLAEAHPFTSPSQTTNYNQINARNQDYQQTPVEQFSTPGQDSQSSISTQEPTGSTYTQQPTGFTQQYETNPTTSQQQSTHHELNNQPEIQQYSTQSDYSDKQTTSGGNELYHYTKPADALPSTSSDADSTGSTPSPTQGPEDINNRSYEAPQFDVQVFAAPASPNAKPSDKLIDQSFLDQQYDDQQFETDAFNQQFSQRFNPDGFDQQPIFDFGASRNDNPSDTLSQMFGKGETFGAPDRQPPKYDEKTGYHY